MADASDGKLYELAGVENHEDEVNAWVLTKWRMRGQDQITRLMPTSRLTFERDIRRRANQPWTSARSTGSSNWKTPGVSTRATPTTRGWPTWAMSGAWYLLTAWQGD
jgi:hypothetical protein